MKKLNYRARRKRAGQFGDKKEGVHCQRKFFLEGTVTFPRSKITLLPEQEHRPTTQKEEKYL